MEPCARIFPGVGGGGGGVERTTFQREKRFTFATLYAAISESKEMSVLHVCKIFCLRLPVFG